MPTLLNPQTVAFSVFGGLWSNRSPLNNPVPGAPLMLDASNVEHTDHGTLRRRPGFGTFATTVAGDFPRDFFSFRRSGSLVVVADLQARVADITGGTVSTVHTPATSTNRYSFAAVGGTLYFTKKGEEGKKWRGGSVEKWGILSPLGDAIKVIEHAATGANVAGPDVNWTNPGNATNFDSSFATVTLNAQDPAVKSNPLRTSDFGFSIPADAIIVGIEGEVRADFQFNQPTNCFNLRLVKAGTPTGTLKSFCGLVAGEATYIVGGSADLWGTTWTPQDINDSTFGIQMVALGNIPTLGPSYTASVDYLRVNVYYKQPGSPVVSVATNIKSPGTLAGTNWTTPSNAGASDNQWAQYSAAGQDDLRATNFGYSLPSNSLIEGIEVLIEGHATGVQAADRQIRVGLTKDGTTLAGNRKFDVTLPQNQDAVIVLGHPADLWGTTWSQAEIQSANFGVLISDNDGVANGTIRIDHVRVRVSHNKALRPTRGYKYVYCFKNEQTGHVSTASKPSPCTNTFNGAVTVTGERSTDPQVDVIQIYRTKDGGGTFFLAGEVPNPSSGGWSFLDGTPDNLLGPETAPLAGLNNPPPDDLEDIVFFLGRVWGHVDNILYYSGGGEIINGVPEEAWSSLNHFIFPEPIVAKLPHPLGLIVVTDSNFYVVRGVDRFSFFAMKWLSGVGALNRQAVWAQDDSIFIFTSKREVLLITSDQRQDIGFPIVDKLDAIDPALATVSVHSCGCESPALFLCDGAGSYYRYSLLTQAWSGKNIVAAGLTVLKSVEATAGHNDLLGGHGTSGSPILKRDISVNTDRGTTYAASLTLGSFMLAQAGTTSILDAITLIQKNGTIATPSLRLNSLTDAFSALGESVNEPPELAATSLLSKRFYTHSLAQSQVLRHAQVKIDWAAANDAAELLELGLLFRSRAA